MKRKTMLLAFIAALIIIALILGRRREDGDLPPIGHVAPPEWQEFFRRMEDGEVPMAPVDDFIDENGKFPEGGPYGTGS